MDYGTDVYKSLESCWYSLLTILQWANTTPVISRCGTCSLFLSLVIFFQCFQVISLFKVLKVPDDI